MWEHVAFNVEAVPNLQDAPGDSLWHKSRADSGRDPEGAGATPAPERAGADQTPYYTPAWADHTHDPDKGKQLVQQAKSEGASTEITFSTTPARGCARRCSEWPAAAQDIGITINIKNTSADTFFGQWLPEGKYEMGEWAWREPRPYLDHAL